MGQPIITTDAPGCRETVANGVNGFLAPIKNAHVLVEAIDEFIQNPDLIEQMGIESRKIAGQAFNIACGEKERVIDLYYKLCRMCL